MRGKNRGRIAAFRVPGPLHFAMPLSPEAVLDWRHRQEWKGTDMSIARVTEISATSSKSFEDAVNKGIKRASKTLRNVTSAWVKEQSVRVSNGKIEHYQVNLMITFVLEDDANVS